MIRSIKQDFSLNVAFSAAINSPDFPVFIDGLPKKGNDFFIPMFLQPDVLYLYYKPSGCKDIGINLVCGKTLWRQFRPVTNLSFPFNLYLNNKYRRCFILKSVENCLNCGLFSTA